MYHNACIALLLDAPLQSWGTSSRFTYRGTEAFPTKSAIIGLIAAALGVRKDAQEAEALRPLSALRMTAVSVPRTTGKVHRLEDFHTIAGGYDHETQAMSMTVTADGEINKNPVITRRHYLTDSRFIILLEGHQATLDRIAAALKNPVWGMWLGRKSCIPANPVLVGTAATLAEAWAAAAKAAKLEHEVPMTNFDHVFETTPTDDRSFTTPDQPTAFGAEIGLRHTTRRIRIERRVAANAHL